MLLFVRGGVGGEVVFGEFGAAFRGFRDERVVWREEGELAGTVACGCDGGEAAFGDAAEGEPRCRFACCCHFPEESTR